MIIIGHRGARGLAPENTLAALQAGLAQGVDMLELDVRLTQDGVVVVHHDPQLHVTGEPLIAEHTYAELCQLKPDLPTLAAAITAVARRVPLRIEIKPGEPVAPVLAVMQNFLDADWQLADFSVCSFSQSVLREVRLAYPELTVVVNENWRSVWARHRARQLHTKHIAMKQEFLWFGLIRSLAQAGYSLTTYTLNDPKKARRWQQSGLTGVVTDYPDRFKTT